MLEEREAEPKRTWMDLLPYHWQPAKVKKQRDILFDGVKDAMLHLRSIDKGRIISPRDIEEAEKILSKTLKETVPDKWTKRASAFVKKLHL